MIQSLSIRTLSSYVSAQLNNIFPDGKVVNLQNEMDIIEEALTRLEFCFKHVALKHYFDGEAFEFSDGFGDLHTKSYANILEGKGFPLMETRKGDCKINLVKIKYLTQFKLHSQGRR